MAEEPLIIYKDQLGPSIHDTIFVNDKPYDLTGASVNFMMRLTDSATVKVNRAAQVLQTGVSPNIVDQGKVRFDWQSADTDTPGRYSGWWRITIASRSTDTREFRIDVRDHAPGEELRIGLIADRTSDYLPGSLDSMKASEWYGDEAFQRTIDVVKYALFSTVVPAYAEATYYSPPVADYAAIRTAIELIPHAVDFYNRISQTKNTSGTDESVSYPDRQKALWDIYARLRAKIDGMSVVLEDGTWVLRSARALAGGPVVSHVSLDKVTPDPSRMPGLTASIVGISDLPWTAWS